jgi:hypothetical protein
MDVVRPIYLTDFYCPNIGGHYNQGLAITQFYTLALDKKSPGNVLVVGGTQDRGSHLGGNVGVNWNRIQGGDGFACALANNGRTVYASSQNGDVYRDSIDASGAVYYQSALNIFGTLITPINAKKNSFATIFTLDPLDENRMYFITSDSLWVHSNLASIPKAPLASNGPIMQYNRRDGWKSYPLPQQIRIQNFSYDLSFVTAVTAVNLGSSTRLYLGVGSSVVHRIENANTTPTIANSAPLIPFGAPGNISSLTADPRNPDRVIAAISNYNLLSMYLSEDAGKTWKPVSGNLEQNPNGSGAGPGVLCSEILYVNDKPVYFAGTTAGLYSTTTLNGSNTVWKKEATTTIGNSVVTGLTARQSDGVILAATYGNGIFGASYPSSTSPVLLPKPPVISFLPDVVTKRGVALEVPITVSDDNESSLAVDIQQSNLRLSYRVNYFMSGTGGQRTGKIIPFPIEDTTTVTVAAMNKYGLTAKRTFKWTISNSLATSVADNNVPMLLDKCNITIAPNPSYGQARIQIVTPSTVSARVRIMSMRGEEVFATPFERYSPGKHECIWDGKSPTISNISSGMYICCIEWIDFNGNKQQQTRLLHYFR